MTHVISRTKAETLDWLAGQGFPVPKTLYFTVSHWRESQGLVLEQVREHFMHGGTLAIRSSAQSEDGSASSQAGAFLSILHIPSDDVAQLSNAVDAVRDKLTSADDQIIIQPMVAEVIMSGVIMTRHLDDGSPYYTVSYDDTSGRTDTITSGMGTSKTVYIYKGVKDEYFDSPRLRKVVALAQSLERVYADEPLDIEFALDTSMCIHLLQVRGICTASNWRLGIAEQISGQIGYVESFVRHISAPRFGLFGGKSILGVMPDWNPAEMIGVSPRPLALSLYRELITRRVWSLAREHMGYRNLPPVELMLSIGGRPYIDVRASFNSFLPQSIPRIVCGRLVDAWLERLDKHPNFHDKVEFEIVHTIAEPDMAATFAERYPGLLSKEEFTQYAAALVKLTNDAVTPNGTLEISLQETARLKEIQENKLPRELMAASQMSAFDLALRIGTALEQCRSKGTLPFAVAARHGFIAEALLRAAVRCDALEQERVNEFKRGIHTVAGDMTRDFGAVYKGKMSETVFLKQYGHLRPGTYDILSPAYREQPNLFSGIAGVEEIVQEGGFALTSGERASLDSLLESGGLTLTSVELLAYAKKAIAAREYVKFVFTRHVSHILTLLAAWGERLGLDKEQVSMLPTGEVLDSLAKPLHIDRNRHYLNLVRQYMDEYDLMRSFKMAYLIRSPRDIYVVPQHRSAPNFITSGRISAPVFHLHKQSDASVPLEGCIVCIESADPGYDWIFSRNIAGLITCFGGTNSHMAIRCAEYGLPAAIGCGEHLFGQIKTASSCVIDCAGKTVTPMGNCAEEARQ